jgi:hypothetical protein
LMVTQACTKGAATLPNRSKVTVVALVDRTTLLVEPLA